MLLVHVDNSSWPWPSFVKKVLIDVYYYAYLSIYHVCEYFEQFKLLQDGEADINNDSCPGQK